MSDRTVRVHEPSVTFSICVPTYNRAAYVVDAIESALAQTYAPFEIVIVDDGSTDDTLARLAPYASRGVRIIAKEHSGAPKTRNRAIAEARGEFVVWLDSDDRLEPETLAAYARMIQTHPDVDVLYGKLAVVDKDMVPTGKVFSYEDWYARRGAMVARCVHEDPIPNPGTAVRRSVFDTVGVFDEGFRRAHDYEWFSRACSQLTFKYVDRVVSLWRWHDSNMSSGSVRVDTSFEVRIVRSLLMRHTLRELFPDAGWSEVGEARAKAGVYLQLALRMRALKDRDAAEEFVAKSREVYPSQQADEIAALLIEDARRGGVLLVAHNFPPQWRGGVEVYTQAFACALAAQGTYVSVLYPVYEEGLRECRLLERRENGYTVVELRHGMTFIDPFLLREPAMEKVFLALLGGGRFSVVHFEHLMRLPFSFVDIARAAGCVTAMTLHDFWLICPRIYLWDATKDATCEGPVSEVHCADCYLCGREGITAADRRGIETLCAQRQQYARLLLSDRVDLISAPSAFVAEAYRRCGFGNGRIEVVPPGMTPTPPVPSSSLPRAFTFTFLGSVSTVKNVPLLLAAFRKTQLDARLLIRGHAASDMTETLRAAVAADPRIVWGGAYTDADRGAILAETDVLVLPSLQESFSLVIREAFAAGLPVIASRVGAIPEIVTHMTNGLLFDPLSEDDLRACLERMATDAPLRAAFAAAIPHIVTIAEDAQYWSAKYTQAAARRASLERICIAGVDVTAAVGADAAKKDAAVRIERHLSAGRREMALRMFEAEFAGCAGFDTVVAAIRAGADHA